MAIGELSISQADIMRQVLIDHGIGTASGSWRIFSRNEPSSPDDVITIYNTQGFIGNKGMLTGRRKGFHGIQFRIRSAQPKTGWIKANAIAALERTLYNYVVNVVDESYCIHALHLKGDIIDLGKEKDSSGNVISQRNILTLNGIVQIELVS